MRGGADLGEHVGAVPVLVHHAGHPAYLALDLSQPAQLLVLAPGVARRRWVGGLTHVPAFDGKDTVDGGHRHHLLWHAHVMSSPERRVGLVSSAVGKCESGW